ncbi:MULTISPECIES: FliI/YscN family ATPase [Ramlibacter]|uniref:FliI/YscN family ATPase n=1 Tax=Ramlibacter pinisoli TaxID=2682844 RepID=A0A6N8IUR1_9BURK|nr:MULTISPECIES: FliI/YscN family ATPase [Ramlibacter]MBA2964781.1 FliI/YscN family ATPase [Ramlibacter sp. CGMCC 1.13660]MVQ29746.1 FliI/YscN family ATPase [Ramlibacter pinisoli]
MSVLRSCLATLREAPLQARSGRVCRIQGLALGSLGPAVAVGQLCRVVPASGGAAVLAEVVGCQGDERTLLAYGSLHGIGADAAVVAVDAPLAVQAGPALLGRVIDAFGEPLDGSEPAPRPAAVSVQPDTNPLDRPPIDQVLETGVRVIDALLTLGRGQRVGIFAGSGVGKSSLLGLVARHVQADVNVVALIGERGREVREFIDRHLGPAGLARSVVVVATSDQPALARVRAAHTAVDIARQFARTGRHVVLTMDSVTRLAMARREIGLASGEPATARGYTPSVFAELPGLCERCGTDASGGSVTALWTVLVEGGDLDEPVADSLRALLDGHIVLSRELAQQGHFPPIDVLRSVSRLQHHLADPAEREAAQAARNLLALLDRNRPLVDLGAYQPGAQPALDRALALEPQLLAWMRQAEGGVARATALRELRELLATGGAA